MPSSSQALVAVDGATGYLGNHLVTQLRQSNVPVRCLVHPGARAADIEFLKSTGAEMVTVQLSDGSGLEAALKGAHTAVHLIGSIAPPKGQKLEDLHGGQTACLVQAARQAGVEKLVQVTALGAAADAASTYHRTKWQAEEHVRKSDLKWVIFRPSLIVGKQVGNRNSKLITRYVELIAKRNAVPVIGSGSNRLQPVFVVDLTQAMEKAIVNGQFDNQTYEIGGDEILSMRQIVEHLMTVAGVNKKIYGVPPLAARVLAAVCETVQRVATLSRDQIKLSLTDNVCTQNSLRPVFGIEPTTMEIAFATYLSSPLPGGVLESSGNRR